MTPGVYKFYPKKHEGVTTYGLTTSSCPFENNDEWLDNCKKFYQVTDLIDPKSSMSAILTIRYFKEISQIER